MTSNIMDMKPQVDAPRTGIERADRKRLVNGLCGLLADTYLLLVKTHGYHWNVVGPMFVSLHKLTEEQYEDLFEAVDDLAERVRALGYPAPGSFAEMIALSALHEEGGRPTAEDKVRNLVIDHETIVRRLRDTAEIAAELRDDVTADMLTQRMAFHEKAIWMLRSTLAA